jgi:alpha-beta hydrolase superfamily lysophospholipase
VKKQIGEFLGFGGIRLCMQSWLPDEKNRKAAVIIMHGGNNQCDMDEYKPLIAALTESGYAVYSFDQRGHGRSEGARGYFAGWRQIRGDFASFIRIVHTECPNKKIFAFGISFGACQVIDQAIIAPHLLSGIIPASFSTIPIKLPLTAKFFMNVLGKAFPQMTLPTEGSAAFPGAKEKLEGTELWRDPFCADVITLGFMRNLFSRQIQIASELKYVTVPVLHIQGADDIITPPDSSITSKIGTKDYTYKTYEKTGHSVFFSENVMDIVGDIVNWLNDH